MHLYIIERPALSSEPYEVPAMTANRVDRDGGVENNTKTVGGLSPCKLYSFA